MLLVLALFSAKAPRAAAGDREWATAGKVLTGLLAAKVIHEIAEPRRVVVQAPPQVIYYQPAPAFVAPHQPQIIYAPPPQVLVQQPAVQVQPAPVYVQTAPAGPVVYVQQVPVMVHPAPVVTYTYGPVCRPRVFIGARW